MMGAIDSILSLFFFFFMDAAPPELSPLPLPAALPFFPGRLGPEGPLVPELPADLGAQVDAALREDIGSGDVSASLVPAGQRVRGSVVTREAAILCGDRKSTRLNSSHLVISYAVFCLKK